MKGIISKKYTDIVVFNNFSFTVKEGVVNALTGQSGKGKTTLLRILCGLETNDQGDLSEFSKFRYSYVFQEDRLLPWLSPYENIALVKDENVDKNEIIMAMEAFKLPIHDKNILEFSGGMKRRIAILRALFAPFDFLLLDEPFTGLDDDIKKLCIDFILNKVKNKTVILSSHDENDLHLMDSQNIIVV